MNSCVHLIGTLRSRCPRKMQLSGGRHEAFRKKERKGTSMDPIVIVVAIVIVAAVVFIGRQLLKK